MQVEGWTGLIAALTAGAINGSVLMPMKLIRNWAWENTWLLFAICAYVLSPWTVALYSIPHLGTVYEHAGLSVTAVTCLLGMGWGFAVVLFGIAVNTVGLSISSAILYGCSVALGSIGALALIDRSKLLTPGGIKILVWDLVLLLGVLFCAQAGRTREPASAILDRARTRRGVAISFLAGVLSTLFNIVLAYGDPIRRSAVEMGADPNGATNAIWSLAVTSGAVPSIVWCVVLLNRNSTWGRYRDRLSGNALTCIGMGAAWILATVLYGFATTRLGPFGAALGWPVYMSATILSGISWGLLLGEWRGAPRPSVRLLWAGVTTQILAIVLLSAF